MSLDIYFFKKDFDIQKSRVNIDTAFAKLQAAKEELEQLEADYKEATLSNLNVTHNLNNMAKAVGLYEVLWRPEKIGISTASQMILPLEKGIEELEANPAKYREFNPPNGYGGYENFVGFCKSLLDNCREYPDAVIEASA